MNVLIVDFDRTGLDMAYRAAEAGHAVRWWVPKNKDGSTPRTGDGFPGVHRVGDWRREMGWAKSGLIVNLFNDRAITAELDKYRSMGWPVFGPSVKSARLEWDRAAGMKMFERAGMKVPKYHEFQNMDAALRFAWKADQSYAFKTLGDSEDKALSFVPADPADLVGWLETKIKSGLQLKGKCILQEKIDILCECGISAWMGKDGFLPDKFNLNFEHKKLMPGDYGQNTGEMGTVCKYVENGELPELLLSFEQELRELGHIGDTDIGGAITKQGEFVPFEWSLRFGWPSTFILFASHLGDPVQWMRDALDGHDTLQVDTRAAVGVVMAQPPFPMQDDDPKKSVGNVVTGIDAVWDRVSPVELMIAPGPVMKDDRVAKGQTYQTTGDYICCVTALGPDPHDAVAEVYAAADRIKYPDRLLRNDIGKRLESELPKVRALGFDEFPEW